MKKFALVVAAALLGAGVTALPAAQPAHATTVGDPLVAVLPGAGEILNPADGWKIDAPFNVQVSSVFVTETAPSLRTVTDVQLQYDEYGAWHVTGGLEAGHTYQVDITYRVKGDTPAEPQHRIQTNTADTIVGGPEPIEIGGDEIGSRPIVIDGDPDALQPAAPAPAVAPAVGDEIGYRPIGINDTPAVEDEIGYRPISIDGDPSIFDETEIGYLPIGIDVSDPSQLEPVAGPVNG